MNGTPANATGAARPAVTVRCIDEHTAKNIEVATGHRPHELDMIASTSDGRIFAILYHNGQSHREEGHGSLYIDRVKNAYRSFLAKVRPVDAPVHRPSAVIEDVHNYEHEPGYGP